MSKAGQMLLNGVNHVAIVTKDTDRRVAFYWEVFEAEVAGRQGFEGFWLTFIRIGETAELNVFHIDGNTEADRQTPMFARGASDRFVTDFSPALSVETTCCCSVADSGRVRSATT